LLTIFLQWLAVETDLQSGAQYKYEVCMVLFHAVVSALIFADLNFVIECN